MYLTWTNSYEVGHPVIDKQHKDLFAQANILLDALKQGKGKEELGKIIAFAESYVLQHFRDEEQALAKVNYPQLQQHKQEHEAFKIELQKLKAKFEQEGPTPTIAIELNAKVVSWLSKHVSGSDQAYAKYLKAA